MRVFFRAEYPVFGRSEKPLSLAYQQRSPYFWWWQFLKRNDQYVACCAAGGNGELAALYADFNDVRTDDFKLWWGSKERGAVLFGEKHLAVPFKELNDSSEWGAGWTADNVMVVSVPLESSKRQLQKLFGELLMKRHKGERGRKKLSDSGASTAMYPLHRVVSIHTLRIQLAVYDAVIANKRNEGHKTLAQIGKELKLVPTAMPNVADDQREAAHKRNVMAATVSRHFKDAERIVANTANGKFPNSTL